MSKRQQAIREEFMPFRPIAAQCLALTALVFLPESGSAQVLASQLGKVAQTVDGTTITVEYYRPVARGRELFGRVVKWDETWTPGANWATTLEVDKDVRINGKPVPKGKYSVWMQTEKEGPWTVMLNKKARLFHTVHPSKDEEQLRFSVTPEQGPPLEVLTWSFPAVMRDGAALRMQWGTTLVQFHVSVDPSRPAVVTAEERAGYVGSWTVNVDGEGTDPSVVARVEIVDVNGTLRVRGNPIEPDYDSDFDLIAIGGSQFHPSYYRHGQPFGMESAETFVFRVEKGRATSFEVRGPDDMPFARAVRTK
jgi:endonuclease YncB( thermonuclease family)